MAHYEEITRIISQRVLKEQRVWIQHMLLNLSQVQRLRLGQGGVSGAACANLRPQLLVFVSDGVYLFGEVFGLRGSVLAIQQGELRRRLRLEQLLQGAFAL